MGDVLNKNTCYVRGHRERYNVIVDEQTAKKQAHPSSSHLKHSCENDCCVLLLQNHQTLHLQCRQAQWTLTRWRSVGNLPLDLMASSLAIQSCTRRTRLCPKRAGSMNRKMVSDFCFYLYNPPTSTLPLLPFCSTLCHHPPLSCIRGTPSPPE